MTDHARTPAAVAMWSELQTATYERDQAQRNLIGAANPHAIGEAGTRVVRAERRYQEALADAGDWTPA